MLKFMVSIIRCPIEKIEVMENEKKIELKNMNKIELRKYFCKIKEKPFRSDQVLNWIYNQLVTDIQDMQNIPKNLRQRLSRECTLDALELAEVQLSETTGTKKYLFNTADNHKIESVIIPEEERNTLCISTQVGCPLDCKFCATGVMGYTRNLTTAEIVDQYIHAARDIGKKELTNLVFMGMGEPLINYAATIKALEILGSELNNAISRNRITISTVGIPQRIEDLANSELRVKLALSLHSPFDKMRSVIMPINDKYPLAQVLDAVKYYTSTTRTRVTFEYVMLKGFNDREEDLRELVRICSKVPSKINLIPFNSIAHMAPEGISANLVPSSFETIIEFAEELRDRNITVMIRDTRGDDIAAACGQLAIKHQ